MGGLSCGIQDGLGEVVSRMSRRRDCKGLMLALWPRGPDRTMPLGVAVDVSSMAATEGPASVTPRAVHREAVNP